MFQNLKMFSKKRIRRESEENAFFTVIEPAKSFEVPKAVPVPVLNVPPVPASVQVPPLPSAVPVLNVLNVPSVPKPEVFKPVTLEPLPSAHVFLEDPGRDLEFGLIDQWARKPQFPTSLKPLLIIAPTGSGTTCLIEHYIKHCEHYYDQDISDFLSLGLVSRGPAVFDNIESLDASERLIVKKHLVASKRRIVLTATDAFLEPARAWSKWCTVVKLPRPSVSFIKNVLKAHKPESIHHDYISTNCNGNIASAMQAIQWSVRSGQPDMPSDAPKAVGQLLAHVPVPCIGGSVDCSFIGQLLQLNVEHAPCSIKDLAQTLERFSFLDLVDSSHAFDGPSTWTLIEAISKGHPKVPQNKFYRTEWPKSTKPLAKPNFEYIK